MTGEVETYLRARAAYLKAAEKAEASGESIKKIGEALERLHTKITVINPGEERAPSTSNFYDCQIERDSWPPIDEVLHISEAYHAAHTAMSDAWKAIPPPDRDGVEAPGAVKTRRQRQRSRY
ncbi:hypothetical protein [Roseococcus pinisoli]|uniref:Uncharacterized protein n=1 Tax=Roseococcus pinisoli TaxID=2835040 RepID=A0ABS5QD44_9PROT|nr:hypothetical protein [Roseococcus pinisoli]MBS7810513.1 hypothetical protein [Roseococcus pinisoli]